MESPVPDPNSSVKVTVKPPQIPDLINFRLSNPVTYLKLWWKKVMSKEGIDFRFRIHPVTAIIIISILTLGGFGIGRASVVSYIPALGMIIPTSTPAPSDWVDSGITGKLQLTPNTNKYYLITTSATAVSLQFDKYVDLNKYIGKRILASGSYNSKTHVLIISDILDLEVLPSSPVPVIAPNITPTPSPSPTTTPAEPAGTETPTSPTAIPTY